MQERKAIESALRREVVRMHKQLRPANKPPGPWEEAFTQVGEIFMQMTVSHLCANVDTAHILQAGWGMAVSKVNPDPASADQTC